LPEAHETAAGSREMAVWALLRTAHWGLLSQPDKQKSPVSV